MFKNHIKYISIMLLLLASPIHSIASEINPWMQMASQDIEAIHKLLIENHPGAMDSENPAFKNQLDGEYKTAKDHIKNIKNYIDYKFIVANYVNGFKDGHLGIYFSLREKIQPYPGFIARFQNNAFIISKSTQPNKIPNGAELLSCDGKSTKEMMLKDVFPIYARNPMLEASWYTNAPYLLQGSLPSWETPYKNCLIRFNGHLSEVTLQYSRISEVELYEKINRIFLGKNTTFHIDYLNNNIVWVRLPRFYTNDISELESMHQIIKESQKLKKYKHIVFDLRGNTGGDSSWGEEILANIYGKKYITNLERSLNKETSVEWRVSKRNLDYLESSLLNYKRVHKNQSINTQCFSNIVQHMKNALKQNIKLMIETCDINKTASIEKTEPHSKARLILVTDGFCGSACLDFLDTTLKIPGSIHMGLPTTADTNYMDLSEAPLPSSIATLSYAMKIYRHRLRGSNESYQPSIRFSGNMANDGELKQWVLNHLKSKQ